MSSSSFSYGDRKQMMSMLLERLNDINGTTNPSSVSTDGELDRDCELGRLEIDGEWTEIHGFRGKAAWIAPRKVVHCDAEARPGYASTLAHEYNDEADVLLQKVSVLAQLLKTSKNCILYTGAGISTAAGIGDYATQSRNTASDTVSAVTMASASESQSIIRSKLKSPLLAQPTYSHYALTALYHKNFIHRWVQQNHDGLPQKAGLPQEAINEIHGAWYDVSNPVVTMSGSLKTDLFEDMLNWEQKADLTLSMGTSMSGMNSDRVFTTVSKKAKSHFARKATQESNVFHKVPPSIPLGGVIVGLQRTQYDSLACLRIYATIDDVMRLLLRELEQPAPPMLPYRPTVPPTCEVKGKDGKIMQDVYRIPYDASGKLVLTHEGMLDLREDAKVKLISGPYTGDEGVVIGKNKEGHYKIQFMHQLKKGSNMRRPFERVLGCWWVQAAACGTMAELPIANI